MSRSLFYRLKALMPRAAGYPQPLSRPRGTPMFFKIHFSLPKQTRKMPGRRRTIILFWRLTQRAGYSLLDIVLFPGIGHPPSEINEESPHILGNSASWLDTNPPPEPRWMTAHGWRLGRIRLFGLRMRLWI